MGLLQKVFGTQNERELKRLQPIVDSVNELEARFEQLSDSSLRDKTDEFRERLEAGESLEDIMAEAFAVVREASKRTLKMRHFDVQVLGAIVLHEGKIAEMRTGEGKTLAATMPLYLNALTGRGSHVITVNDYLATRDAEWMGHIYEFLGMTVGVIVHDMEDEDRKAAYGCDITYGTNNEFGFDYLRDNMKFRTEDYVQRSLHYAIVDEVDSILIDEARTPLIISGPTEESTDKYYKIDRHIPKLKKEDDYTVDEKAKAVSLTDEGMAKIEKLLDVDNLYEPALVETLHHVNQALKAHVLFKRDVDYVVKEGEVIIVDEFTGRLMPGRRFSDGLHQALEAKEKVKIENENQTLASITFQNYFRMYGKLAGMTGTADTEAVEFHKIYKLEVMAIPTNMPMIRVDNPDVIYRDEQEKYEAAIEDIIDCHERGQPVLVGTISIENSEKLSRMLKRKGVSHNVLNAKQHEREAEIISQAGRKGTVTLSTNMAGRGTDIVLGGNPEMIAKMESEGDEELYQEIYEEELEACTKEREEVLAAGGLHILGTERHESRRIDNQLRGRSGRQGDPGSSRFYLSLEDDLLRIFGSEKISGIMDRLGMEKGEPIEHKLVSRSIESAQKKVEAHNFEIRKHLLDYDDVMNKQRMIIYKMRRDILDGVGIKDKIKKWIQLLADDIVFARNVKKDKPEEWDWQRMEEASKATFGVHVYLEKAAETFDDLEALADHVGKEAMEAYHSKETEFGADLLSRIETDLLLMTIDSLWKDHLLSMDHLKEGIGLRGYGQKDPLVEYKREGFDMFEAMNQTLENDVISRLMRIQLVSDDEARGSVEVAQRRKTPQRMTFSRGQMEGGERPEKQKPVRREGKKIGRNQPCPCGSGKKYKKCCGA